MKNVIRTMLLACALLFCIGQCNAQVQSNNKEFSYNYVDSYSILTGLGDIIHTGEQMPHGINDEGHPYAVMYYGKNKITKYYSAPWVENKALFVEYNAEGELIQSLLIMNDTFCYWSEGKSREGYIKNGDYSKALSLWKNK